jgi:hypothetical protein
MASSLQMTNAEIRRLPGFDSLSSTVSATAFVNGARAALDGKIAAPYGGPARQAAYTRGFQEARKRQLAHVGNIMANHLFGPAD